MRRIFQTVLALAVPLGAAIAQETATVAPGSRVRVTTDTRRATGTLESIDSTTIVVRRRNGATVAFPRDRGTSLDVSAGPVRVGVRVRF